MKVQINAEMSGQEVVDSFVAKLKDAQVSTTAASVKVMVFSEKGDKWLEFKPENIKLTFASEG